MNKEDKITIAKLVGAGLTEIGAGIICGTFVAAGTPNGIGRFKKVCCAVAGVGLCAAAANAAKKGVDDVIDGIVEGFKFGWNMTNGKPDEEEVDEE